MTEYNYDETGAIVNFFALTMLSVFMIPFSFYTFSSSKKGWAKKLRWAGFVIGWSLFAWFIYRAATTTIQEKGLWDPYEILGIDKSADEGAIKKAFKRLSLRYHPDKVTAEEKEEAEKKFVDISKAHKVLTDEEARKVYDETGHPDGKQAFVLGVALPKWLIESHNSAYVLIFYGLIFGVALPTFVARWWGNAKSLTKSQINNETMAIFYRDLQDGLGFKALVDLLGKAVEFRTIILDENHSIDLLAESIKMAMEKTSDRFEKKKVTLQQRVVMDLYAHLLRVKTDTSLDKEIAQVAEISAFLTSGLLQIAVSKGWLTVSVAIIELNQLIIQGLYQHQSQLMLLDLEPEVLKHFRTKKRNISNIQQLLKMEEEERKSLLRSLSDEQYEKTYELAKKYPTLNVVKVEFEVEGEPAVIPNSLVTLTVKFHGVWGELVPVPDKEEESEKWWEDNQASISNAFAPHFPVPKKPVTWVILANQQQGRIICVSKVVGLDGMRTAKLRFQSPPNEGTWDFHIHIKSDSYLGIDQVVNAKMVVQPSSVAPLQEEEDDISEPEEHPMHVAAMQKRVKPKEQRGEYDDSSDSDDDPELRKKGFGHCHDDDDGCCD